MRKVLIIAGPTASGKTARAVETALKRNGEIINSDSLQVYNCLKILTAFPTDADMKLVPHKLFGYLGYQDESSAVAWATLASQKVEEALEHSSLPIIVGGTGLYVNTLVNGISPLPEISSAVRNHVASMDYEELCAKLYKADPGLIGVVTKQQHHQMLRAYEIFLKTGKSILHFRNLPRQVFLSNVEYEYDLIECDRTRLYGRINARFEKMLDAGAVDEVRCFLASIGYTRCDRSMLFKRYRIFNAIGAKEITMYLDGEISFEQMKEIATLNLRHYAKRQMTWLRHHIPL
ncbi:MAG: tRNA (adenosine(37)-N6)-dimethylallyltransferase MiaA [Holosporales bacterium]|jgi:tRNA dimethylallyltransferase|nr:tRNA (adenosine(37)-N6)-dimethylallyltransferase MiaA [Holosporales bacterium]